LRGLFGNLQPILHKSSLAEVDTGLDERNDEKSRRQPHNPVIRRGLTWGIAGVVNIWLANWCAYLEIVRGRKLLAYCIWLVSFLVFVGVGILYWLALFPWSWD